jgi:CRISPR/Cas system-associated exonuclease Cas4 (RecB family)
MLKEIIYDYFNEKKEKENYTERELNFAPSYFHKCKRQIAYKKLNYEPSNPLTEANYAKFEMGNSVHDSIQNILKKIGIWIEGEDFKNIEWCGLNWIYRIDGKIQKGDYVGIIEIKSVYASGFTSVEKEAKPEHELQLLLYMIFEHIENGILFYIGRDNGFMVEYNYRVDTLYNKYADEIENKIKDLTALKSEIEKGIIPDRDFNILLKNSSGVISFDFQKDKVKYKSDWQCSYCQWKNLCWQQEIKEIKNHKFFIDGKFID